MIMTKPTVMHTVGFVCIVVRFPATETFGRSYAYVTKESIHVSFIYI